MERLKGKTILIGKEPGQGRLFVCVAVNGQPKAAAIGHPGSVPNCVSRCKPAEGVAHCKIEVDPSGNMILTNLKPQNVTFVNDAEIMSKRIDASSRVALGKDKFPVPLSAVVEVAKKLVPSSPPPAQEFSIRHLEKVWNEYEESLETIQRRQQQMGKRRMLPIMIGSASGIAAPIFATLVATASLYVTVPIAFVSFLIYMKNYREKDTSIEDRKTANNFFIDNYVCPNPACRHFMGNQPYKILKQNKKCLYCGCLLTEK